MALELTFATPVAAQAPKEEKPVPKYVTAALAAYAASDVLDMVSTGMGLAHGAREQNPVLKPFAGQPAALGAANGLLHGATTFVLWKMAKHHPKRATIISAVLTSVELSVAKHNFDLARRNR